MEVRLVERYASLRGCRILEIGCGDGRLTRELARLASSVVAVEPDSETVVGARRAFAAEGIDNVSFRVGSAGSIRAGARAYDVALFSWSL